MSKSLNVNKRKAWRYLRYFLAFFFILFFFCLPKQLFDDPYSSVVLDREGVLMGARIAPDGQWRFPLESEIPSKLKKCIIRFEDDYFYYHWGINPISISKAFVSNLKARKVVRGGSTITMQTIRMARRQPRTILEKMKEAIWATRLEFRYSKDQILNLYASHAPFGGNVVGYSAASWRYFGHTATALSWAEAATLAVLPNAPSAIHLSKERESLKLKRDKLLRKLYEKGDISETDYLLAKEEELPHEPLALPQLAPHLVDKLALESPQKEVITTIDAGLQSKMEALLNEWNLKYQQHHIKDIAAILIDVETSEVLAYHGNSGFSTKRVGSQVDIIQSPRSTGSILKPFLLAAMLDEGKLLVNQLLPDIPININGFTPQNFSLRYEGAVPAAEAISRSLNIPSVYMLKDYSVPKFYDKLKKLGLSTLTKPAGHYGLSLILGGAEGKLGEITAAYMHIAQIALGKSSTYPKYRLGEEDILWKPTYSAGASWQTLDVLKEVNRPGEIAWKMLPSIQTIAWKTGTSHGFRDGWAVGVTPKYAVGVWVGNATGEGNAELVGGRVAGPVLFDIFNALPSSKWFERPKDAFVDAEVCRQSGYLKSRFCNDVDTVLILSQGIRTPSCPYHHLVHLTPDEKYRVYTSCLDSEETIEKSWFTLPPVWEWYYKAVHPSYQVLPPFKEGCGEDYRQPMQFIYPQMNAEILLAKQLEGSEGSLTLDLVHSNKEAIIYWHMDGNYLGETQFIHKFTISPKDGEHNVTVVDNQGNTQSVHFSTTSKL